MGIVNPLGRMAGEESTHSSDDTHFPRSSLSSSERPDSEEDMSLLFKMVYECVYTVYETYAGLIAVP